MTDVNEEDTIKLTALSDKNKSIVLIFEKKINQFIKINYLELIAPKHNLFN